MTFEYTALGFFLRWSARITSLVAIGLLLLFIIGESNTSQFLLRELLGLLFFPIGVAAGLALASWREPLGAVIAVLSLLTFYLIYGAVLNERIPRGPWFIIFTSPAVLFLASWLLHRERDGITTSVERSS